MLIWGFWVLTTLSSPGSSSAQLALSLAVVAAALVVLLAAASLRIPACPAPVRPPADGRRARGRGVPRLADPDAAGRPRPRAPSPYPAAA